MSTQLNVRKAFALASARAAIRWPHGTTSADDLADVLRGAIADMQAETPTAERLLARFVAWADRIDAEGGDNYLNGEGPPHGNGDDAWSDIAELAGLARVVLAKAGALA